MSSIPNQQHLTSANIEMVERVLEQAGIFDVGDSDPRSPRMVAARFLIDAFQQGSIDQDDLALALTTQLAKTSPATLRAQRMADVQSWENEGGSVRRSSRSGSYRFGKRIERDGTWTIHHVFTGSPAQFGNWSMTGLTKLVAGRALRTINTPTPAES